MPPRPRTPRPRTPRPSPSLVRRVEDSVISTGRRVYAWGWENITLARIREEIRVFIDMSMWIWNTIRAFLRAVNFVIPIKSVTKWSVRFLVFGMLLWWTLPMIWHLVPGHEYINLLLRTMTGWLRGSAVIAERLEDAAERGYDMTMSTLAGAATKAITWFEQGTRYIQDTVTQTTQYLVASNTLSMCSLPVVSSILPTCDRPPSQSQRDQHETYAYNARQAATLSEIFELVTQGMSSVYQYPGALGQSDHSLRPLVHQVQHFSLPHAERIADLLLSVASRGPRLGDDIRDLVFQTRSMAFDLSIINRDAEAEMSSILARDGARSAFQNSLFTLLTYTGLGFEETTKGLTRAWASYLDRTLTKVERLMKQLEPVLAKTLELVVDSSEADELTELDMRVLEAGMAWHARVLSRWSIVPSRDLAELRGRKDLADQMGMRMGELVDLLEKAKSHLNAMKYQLKGLLERGRDLASDNNQGRDALWRKGRYVRLESQVEMLDPWVEGVMGAAMGLPVEKYDGILKELKAKMHARLTAMENPKNEGEETVIEFDPPHEGEKKA